MQYYSNELHKNNKILGLDNIDFMVITVMYGVVILTTPHLIFACIPLFLYYMQAKKKTTPWLCSTQFLPLTV